MNEITKRFSWVHACLGLCTLVVCACNRPDATLPEVAAPAASSAAAVELPATEPESCEACEERSCRNFRGQGVDLVKDCFQNASAELAATCRAAVECAQTSKCGGSARGAEECYCGTASTEQCAQGKNIDGACKAAFEAAAGSTDATFVTTHFGDRTLALGNAVFMLQCRSEQCREACMRR